MEGILFIKLPKELGYPAQAYAKLINAIEGMRLTISMTDILTPAWQRMDFRQYPKITKQYPRRNQMGTSY